MVNPEEPLDFLRIDHRRVLAEVAKVQADLEGGRESSSRARIGDALTRLQLLFAGHARAEERTLFPVLRRRLRGGESSIELLREEHEDLGRMLSALRLEFTGAGSTGPGSSPVLWSDFCTLLKEHIRKEEGALFHVAEQILSRDEWRAVDEGLRGDPAGPSPKGRKEEQ